MRALRSGSFLAFLLCSAIAGCSGAGFTLPHDRVANAGVRAGRVPNARPTRCPAADYTCIQHIVIVIQENRSFNNLFMGFPGADTRRTGMAGSRVIPLQRVALEDSDGDISHCWEDAMKAYRGGKMDGFNLEHAESFPIANCPSLFLHGKPVGTSGKWSPYVYVPNGAPKYVREAGPYWQMATQYVLADHYFPTDFGPSFTAHQYLIAGTTDVKDDVAIVNYPGWRNKEGGINLSASTSWSCDSPPQASKTSTLDVRRIISRGTGPFPCFDQYRTIADSLDARGVPWQFFTPETSGKGCPYCIKGDYIWSPFSAIGAVRYGPDWANVVTPQTDVLAAAARGRLKGVTWVVPDGRYSDHSGPYVTDEGPSWVSAIVNAVGTGPQWSSSAVIVLWDDWGGLYDGVAPPQMDFRGLGIRTPLIIVSPYAQHGKVSKIQYEPGSILKFIETVFKLPPIGGACPAPPANGYGYTDCRANVLGGFDFRQAPRAFTPIKSRYPPSKFVHSTLPVIPPDTE
ncbi:MAG TPA: alkaline phosphatase family protein [Candidatus Tumulicola sp.]|nr:alkaline phosphatase family protein [Candidatus Tumulicola sp.]